MSSASQLPVTLACAGVSNCVAATFTNPLDVVKIRLQLHGEGSGARSPSAWSVFRGVVAQDGLTGLWAGLHASLLREGSYSAVRLGSYDLFKDFFKDAVASAATSPADATQPLWQKVAAGCVPDSSPYALVHPPLMPAPPRQPACVRNTLKSVFRRYWCRLGLSH